MVSTKGITLVFGTVLILGVASQNQTTFAPPTPPPSTTATTPTPSANTTTTAPPTTSTSTVAPTTTSPTPKTTPGPTPSPPPMPHPYPNNKDSWWVDDGDKGTTCILLTSAMQITTQYLGDDKKNHTLSVDVPDRNMTVASGKCGKDTQVITLTWENGTLTFAFAKNETAENGGITPGKFAVESVTGSLNKSLFVNATNPNITFTLSDLGAFQTPMNHSYSCMVQEALKDKDGQFTIKLNDFRIEAFRILPKENRLFSSAIDCPADDASDVVPIAVGAALAGLVVIVLIAYLIGRRRSRSRGYQSV